MRRPAKPPHLLISPKIAHLRRRGQRGSRADIAEAFVLGSRIGLLKDGEMVLLGAPAELLESSHPEARAFAACFHDGQAIGRPAWR
jgi:hypothetical protein